MGWTITSVRFFSPGNVLDAELAKIGNYLKTPRLFFSLIGAKMSSGTGNWSPQDVCPDLLYTLLPHIQWNDTCITALPRKYITDAKNRKQVVIVDMETFNCTESIIEDNGLAKFMEEAEEDETLTLHEAKKHFRLLKKG